jgi:hypothetical protein
MQKWIESVAFHVIGCLMGVVLIVAAFAHVASPEYGRGLLKRFAVPLLLIYVFVLAALQLLWSGDPAVYLFLIAASAAAYQIRKRRSRRESGLGGGAERTPIFPPPSNGGES